MKKNHTKSLWYYFCLFIVLPLAIDFCLFIITSVGNQNAMSFDIEWIRNYQTYVIGSNSYLQLIHQPTLFIASNISLLTLTLLLINEGIYFLSSNFKKNILNFIKAIGVKVIFDVFRFLLFCVVGFFIQWNSPEYWSGWRDLQFVALVQFIVFSPFLNPISVFPLLNSVLAPLIMLGTYSLHHFIFKLLFWKKDSK